MKESSSKAFGNFGGKTGFWCIFAPINIDLGKDEEFPSRACGLSDFESTGFGGGNGGAHRPGGKGGGEGLVLIDGTEKARDFLSSPINALNGSSGDVMIGVLCWTGL